jgi:hypothetical protein
MTEDYKSTSPYINTTQRNDLIEYLDLWTQRTIPVDDSDEPLIVSRKYHERPDLLSYDLYGTSEYWWVFAIRNPNSIQDPIYDLVADLEIFVPTKQRVLSFLGSR